MLKRLSYAIVSVLLAFLALPAAAENEFEPQIKEAFESMVKPWLSDAVLIDAIKAQNEKHQSLGAADIDRLDKEWRAEAKAGSGAMIDAMRSNALSQFLVSKKRGSNDLFTEIFVMDNKGLNVGLSDVTSDYMQGDEAKWKKTFKVGPDAIFVDEVEFDDSTQTFQSQLSVSISDPATGKVIGAITFGINVENLM